MQGQQWVGVVSSSDGTHITAVAANNQVWTSINGGASWHNDTSSISGTSQIYYPVTSSANGQVVTVGAVSGDLWTSYDGGGTWIDDSTGNANLTGQSWWALGSS